MYKKCFHLLHTITNIINKIHTFLQQAQIREKVQFRKTAQRGASGMKDFF